jgi:hypothetical protein
VILYFFCLTCDFSFSLNNQNNFIWFIFIDYNSSFFILKALTVASIIRYVCSVGCAVFRKIRSHENCHAMHLACFRSVGRSQYIFYPKMCPWNVVFYFYTGHLSKFVTWCKWSQNLVTSF